MREIESRGRKDIDKCFYEIGNKIELKGGLWINGDLMGVLIRI